MGAGVGEGEVSGPVSCAPLSSSRLRCGFDFASRRALSRFGPLTIVSPRRRKKSETGSAGAVVGQDKSDPANASDKAHFVSDPAWDRALLALSRCAGFLLLMIWSARGWPLIVAFSFASAQGKTSADFRRGIVRRKNTTTGRKFRPFSVPHLAGACAAKPFSRLRY